MLKVSLLKIGFLFLLGCHTIHYKNDSTTNPHHIDYNVEQGYYNLAAGFWEFSAPYDPIYNCKDRDWESIRVRQGFLDVFINLVIEYFAGPIISQHAVSVSCRSSQNL